MKITVKSIHNIEQEADTVKIVTGDLYEVNGFQYCIYKDKIKYMDSSHLFDGFNSCELSSGLRTVLPAFKLADVKRSITCVSPAKLRQMIDPKNPSEAIHMALISKGRKFPLNMPVSKDEEDLL